MAVLFEGSTTPGAKAAPLPEVIQVHAPVHDVPATARRSGIS